MPPFRNAVRFVNGIKRNLEFAQKFNILGLIEGFRRHVKELGIALAQILADYNHFALGQRRIPYVGNSIRLRKAPQGIHLVLH